MTGRLRGICSKKKEGFGVNLLLRGLRSGWNANGTEK